MPGADLSSSDIEQAYLDVRDDNKPLNWLLLTYASAKSDVLNLTATGEGGLDELKENLREDDCAFAYARVEYSNDKESKRVKFVLIKWIGEYTKVMRKAKISVHAADVKNSLRAYSIEVDACDLDGVNEDVIVGRLRKAGGASYDGV